MYVSYLAWLYLKVKLIYFFNNHLKTLTVNI